MIGGHAPYTVPNAGLEMMKEASEITKRGFTFMLLKINMMSLCASQLQP